jgi:PadR family transcriptional regulator, regulatory protein PadR
LRQVFDSSYRITTGSNNTLLFLNAGIVIKKFKRGENARKRRVKMSALMKDSLTVDREKDRANYLLSALEEDILTVLLGRSLYGLQISKAISDASGGIRKIGVGSLYPTLRRLEGKGFVVSYWENNEVGKQENQRGGARRRYYRISPEGSKLLSENRSVRENLLEWQPI